MTETTNIYADAGRRGAANLHQHDLEFTISAADMGAGWFPLVREQLAKELDALVARLNEELPEAHLQWRVSYNGALACGAHDSY